MAVALATLPLNSEVAGGCVFFTTGASGAAAGLAATGLPLTGLATATGFAATFLAIGLAIGFAAFFASGFDACLATTLRGVACFATGFFVAGLIGFFAVGFASFFAAGLTASTGFLAGAFFAGAFFATGFLATGFFATGFFAVGFFTAGLATFFAAAFFAGAFATGFDARAPTAFALPVAALCDRVGAFPFEALTVVELRVVFAISLHHFRPRRPGFIAHVPCTGKPASGILVPLPAASCFGNVRILTRFLLLLLRCYKRWLSPLLGQRCRFYPTCSDYARIAVTRFGPWRGCLLTAWRLLRCQPLCEGGEDPVPETFRFARCRKHQASNHVH